MCVWFLLIPKTGRHSGETRSLTRWTTHDYYKSGIVVSVVVVCVGNTGEKWHKKTKLRCHHPYSHKVLKSKEDDGDSRQNSYCVFLSVLCLLALFLPPVSILSYFFETENFVMKIYPCQHSRNLPTKDFCGMKLYVRRIGLFSHSFFEM